MTRSSVYVLRSDADSCNAAGRRGPCRVLSRPCAVFWRTLCGAKPVTEASNAKKIKLEKYVIFDQTALVLLARQCLGCDEGLSREQRASQTRAVWSKMKYFSISLTMSLGEEGGNVVKKP